MGFFANWVCIGAVFHPSSFETLWELRERIKSQKNHKNDWSDFQKRADRRCQLRAWRRDDNSESTPQVGSGNGRACAEFPRCVVYYEGRSLAQRPVELESQFRLRAVWIERILGSRPRTGKLDDPPSVTPSARACHDAGIPASLEQRVPRGDTEKRPNPKSLDKSSRIHARQIRSSFPARSPDSL